MVTPIKEQATLEMADEEEKAPPLVNQDTF
jgi:hypothetical protein